MNELESKYDLKRLKTVARQEKEIDLLEVKLKYLEFNIIGHLKVIVLKLISIKLLIIV